MKRMIAKPQLGFSEAVKLAFGKITQMSGRSRRSEFWWFMLVYVIGYWVLSTIAAFVLPVVEAQIAGRATSMISARNRPISFFMGIPPIHFRGVFCSSPP